MEPDVNAFNNMLHLVLAYVRGHAKPAPLCRGVPVQR